MTLPATHWVTGEPATLPALFQYVFGFCACYRWMAVRSLAYISIYRSGSVMSLFTFTIGSWRMRAGGQVALSSSGNDLHDNQQWYSAGTAGNSLFGGLRRLFVRAFRSIELLTVVGIRHQWHDEYWLQEQPVHRN